jgi:hypothetical protein
MARMSSGSATRHLGPAVLGLVLFIVAAISAISSDVPRATYGVKSDESTYIMAGLSAAFDRDLAYERRDLERFEGLYHAGPEGIFLKRGKQRHIEFGGGFPFVSLAKSEDPDASRLYFGKSLAYPIAVAPLVRLFGLNGFLLTNVIFLAVTGVCAYLFLAAQMSSLSAAAFTSAFLGASVLPVYGVFLMPETFNVALVTLAYFLWLYKEVAPDSLLAGRWTDWAAAIVLGIDTYSKPLPTAVFVAPLVLLAWTRREWFRGFGLGLVAVVMMSLCFVFNAAVSGEFNYQGGDRKSFYARFPFDAPDATWDRRGNPVTTDTSTPTEVLTSSELTSRLSHNAWYFVVGRHFGFVPYFFPGVVAIAWWLSKPGRRVHWRILVFGAVFLSAIVLLVLLPWTWSGDGGPPGNRYFLSAYPLLLFILPPEVSVAPALVAWIGGALFTAKILTGPFVAAKFTYLVAEKGPLRRLPVELTMANTLPLRLAQPLRGHIQYRNDPGLLLYFLDQNAWPPEPNGMWVSGSARAEIIVRSAAPVERLLIEAESPIHTVVTVTLGASPVTIPIEPGKVAYFSVNASGVHGLGDYDYLMTVRSTEGFIPHLMEPANMDYRNLGVQLRFRPVTTTPPAQLPD